MRDVALDPPTDFLASPRPALAESNEKLATRFNAFAVRVLQGVEVDVTFMLFDDDAFAAIPFFLGPGGV